MYDDVTKPNISRLLYTMVTQILHIGLCHNSKRKHRCAATGGASTAPQALLWDLRVRCRDQAQCFLPCLLD